MEQVGTFQLYEGIQSATVHPLTAGTVIATSTIFTPSDEDPSFYEVTFEDVPVGYYRINLYIGTEQVGFISKAYFDVDSWVEVSGSTSIETADPGPIPGGGVGIVNAGDVLPSQVKQFIGPMHAAANACKVTTQYPGYIVKAGTKVGLIWSYPGMTIAGESVPADPDYDLSSMPERYVAFKDPFDQKPVQLGKIQLGPSGSNTLRLFPPSEVLNATNLYEMEIVWTASGVTQVSSAILSVEQSLVSQALLSTATGPLPYSKVQTRMRDLLQANDILGGYEFSAEEYITAMVEAVQYYNEAPPVASCYSVQNFPHHFHWMNAVISRLLLTASLWQQRNSVDLSGDGISANTRGRYLQLQQMSSVLWEQYRLFVAAKKQKENATLSFRII